MAAGGCAPVIAGDVTSCQRVADLAAEGGADDKLLLLSLSNGPTRRDSPMEAKHGTVVSFNYHLTDDDGSTLDVSEEPLDYLHGFGNIIPGLESALEGTQPGDQRTVVVEPAEGYGEYDPEQVMTLQRDAADDEMELAPGMMVMAETDEGSMPLTIREVSDDTIVVDGNHPLAGQRLHFEVEIVTVRAATEKELEQGYPGE